MSALDHLTEASGQASQSRLTEQKRHLKYALLHLCSSIEVILKERLSHEHWSLVFKDPSKANPAFYDSGTFQSVTFQEALDRLVGICEITFTQREERSLRALRDRRNRLEHFGAVDSLPAVQSSVSEMVGFLIDFVERTFQPDTLGEQQELISEIRTKLGRCRGFVEERWKTIGKEVEQGYSVVECPVCLQRALNADVGLAKCRFCHFSADADSAADQFLRNVLGVDTDFDFAKEGIPGPRRICPHCGNETLVTMSANGYGSGESYCFNCGEEYAEGDLEECDTCGQVYGPVAERGHNLCHACFRSRISKD